MTDMWNNPGLARIAAQMNAELAAQSKMKVGEVVMHPDGYKVYVTDGQYLSNGRVSNFWYWKRVNEDGSLSETTEHGYGW